MGVSVPGFEPGSSRNCVTTTRRSNH